MREAHGRNVIVVHRMADFFGQRHKTARFAGVERHSGNRLDCRIVQPFPAGLAAVGLRKAAIVERRVQGRAEAQIVQDLRQSGRKSTTPPREDGWPPPEMSFEFGETRLELAQDRLDGHKRQFGLVPFAAEHGHRAPLDCLD